MNSLETVEIEELLTQAGFDTKPSREAGWERLKQSQVVTRGKHRIALFKKSRALEVLQQFTIVCENCLPLVAEGETVVVSSANCSVCHGSNTARSARLFTTELKRRDIHRLVIVGGTPQQIVEIKKLCDGSNLECVLLKATAPHTQSKTLKVIGVGQI